MEAAYELPLSMAAFAAVLILPGFALFWAGDVVIAGRRGGESEPAARWRLPPGAALASGVACSVIALALLGGVLLALGLFSANRIALLVLPLAVAGLVPFVRWLRKERSSWATGVLLLVISSPWIYYGLTDVFGPSHSYQWYYWDLGRQLDLAGGIPSWTTEFGEHVRWHPDYVVFNIASEAYRALTAPLSEEAAIRMWRAPTALLGLALLHAVLRLWLPRTPSLVGVGAASITTYFLVKFNAYKPESLGAVVALAAVWLLIAGARARAIVPLMLGGAALGVAVGIHGIAAAAIGMLGLVGVVVEVWAMPPEGRRRAARLLAPALALVLAIVVATGVTLQGRAVVASDAANPGRADVSYDPTYVFLQRHDARFGTTDPPALSDRITDSLSHPWPGSGLGEWGWMIVALAVVAGVAGIWMGAARRGVGEVQWRLAAATLGLYLLVLLGAIAFFAKGFDTYIPQHTGISRIGAYLSLLLGMGVGVGAAGLIALARGRGLSAAQLVALALLIFTVAWSVPTAISGLSERLSVTPTGREALTELRAQAVPGDVVLTNASTRGVIEFATDTEVPVEGRQPVIEDPDFLREANERLFEIERYFREPLGDELLKELRVRWLLVVDSPRTIGSPYSFGESEGLTERLASRNYLRLAWQDRGVALFEYAGAGVPRATVGPRKETPLQAGVSLAAIAILLLASVRWVRR